MLAEVAQETLSLGKGDDRRTSAAVHNPYVRSRERKGPAANLSAATSKPANQEVKAASLKPGTPSDVKVKEEPKTASQSTADTDKPSSSAPTKKTPALKRGGSSNGSIMQAFSKAAAATKAKKEKITSLPNTPSGDDSSMQPLSDDGEDDDIPQPKPRRAVGQKTRKEREEELRRMMDEMDEDEEEEDKASTPDEPEEEPVEEPLASKPVKEEPSEVVATSGNGRRRGRRKVMRKKQIMDEQGYLGTRPALLTQHQLTNCSDHSGNGLGVFLRR